MYCKHCGTPLHAGVVICPECGARQRRQASSVRCASCHGRVPLTLSVCPHCGRDVRPAGPRWGLVLVAAIAMVAMVLWGLGKLPVERIGQEIVGVKAQVSGLVQVLGPVSTVEQAAGTPQLVARTTSIPRPTTTPSEEQPIVAPQAEPSIDSGAEESPTSEPAPAEPSPLAQTLTAVPTASQAATQAATQPATPTATPTLPPTPTATAAPPTATVPPPTATTAPGSKANTYRIQSGDTLSGVAQRFNLSLAALLAANRLTANATLRIGQELAIPGVGAPLVPTPTPKPRATPTPTKVALPPTPAPYLPAPVQTNPGDGASYRGDNEQILLRWDAVPGLTSDDKYQVVFRWTETGAPQEKSDLFTTATEIRVPPYLWNKAQQPERQYQWFVRAVRLTTDGQGGELVIPLSPASLTRTFYWN